MSNKDKKNEVLDEHLTKIPKESDRVDNYFWKRITALFIISTLIGGGSIYFRPYFNNGVHVEALVSLILLIIINIILLVYLVRTKKRRYNLAYSLGVCAIWGGYVLGWSVGMNYWWEDVWMMNGFFALIGLGVGQLVFYLGE